MWNRKIDLLVQSFIGDEMPPTDFYKTKQNMHYYCITYMQLSLCRHDIRSPVITATYM